MVLIWRLPSHWFTQDLSMLGNITLSLHRLPYFFLPSKSMLRLLVASTVDVDPQAPTCGPAPGVERVAFRALKAALYRRNLLTINKLSSVWTVAPLGWTWVCRYPRKTALSL